MLGSVAMSVLIARRNQLLKALCVTISLVLFICFIHEKLAEAWQHSWDDMLSLLFICDPANPPSITGRLHILYFHCPHHQQVVLMRLHICHTFYTHGYLSYLMEKSQATPPWCDTCNVRITVLHFLVTCPQYADAYRKYFPNFSLTSHLAESGRYNRYNFPFLIRALICSTWFNFHSPALWWFQPRRL